MIIFTALQNYQSLLFSFIKDVEGVKPDPYRDSVGAPTIGIGFNINSQNSAIRLEVFQQIGLNPSLFDPQDQAREQSYKDQIEQILNTTNTDSNLLRSSLNIIMQTRANDPNYVTAGARRTTFSLQPGAEMEAVFNVVIISKENIVSSWLSGVPASRERAVLVSLAYNGVPPGAPNSLLGPKLRAAIDDGDRAEAWYQIRYEFRTAVPLDQTA